MTYIETLRKSRESKASALHLFLLNFSRNTGHIHAFFEGNDDSSFYTNFIKSFSVQVPIEVYKCGSKKSVYEVYNQIRERSIQHVKALFFVDKDFSDILEKPSTISSKLLA